MKTCINCKEEKSEEHFSYRGGGRTGLQSECKQCSRKRAREYKQEMRNRVGLYKMSKGCEICKFEAKHPCQLDLDHIDPDTKTYKGNHKAYDAGWSWERIKNELSLCIVTCKNCHALRTHEEGHWKNQYSDISMRQSSAQS